MLVGISGKLRENKQGFMVSLPHVYGIEQTQGSALIDFSVASKFRRRMILRRHVPEDP
jgi:hypothetical protein